MGRFFNYFVKNMPINFWCFQPDIIRMACRCQMDANMQATKQQDKFYQIQIWLAIFNIPIDTLHHGDYKKTGKNFFCAVFVKGINYTALISIPDCFQHVTDTFSNTHFHLFIFHNLHHLPKNHKRFCQTAKAVILQTATLKRI